MPRTHRVHSQPARHTRTSSQTPDLLKPAWGGGVKREGWKRLPAGAQGRARGGSPTAQREGPPSLVLPDFLLFSSCLRLIDGPSYSSPTADPQVLPPQRLRQRGGSAFTPTKQNRAVQVRTAVRSCRPRASTCGEKGRHRQSSPTLLLLTGPVPQLLPPSLPQPPSDVHVAVPPSTGGKTESQVTRLP